MNKLYYKILSAISVLSFLIAGCVSSATSPYGTSATNSNGEKINIKIDSPQSHDTLSYGRYKINYQTTAAQGVNLVELYINGDFQNSYKPTASNANPDVYIDLDSTLINKSLSFYLIYYDKNGVNVHSDTVSNIYVTVKKDLPKIPYNLVITKLTSTTINLSWKDSSFSNTTGFEIWRREGMGGDFKLHLTSDPKTFNINDENLNSSISYYYKIRSVNTWGASPFSEVINTAGTGGSEKVPAPTNLTATATSTNIVKLLWTDNSTNENYFKIERKTSYTNFSSIAIVNRNITEYTDSANGISAGAEFFYRIKAISSADSSWSDQVYVKTPLYVLSTPTLESVLSISTGIVEVKWKDNDSHYASFQIERKMDNGSYILIGEAEGYLNSFQDNTVYTGHKYFYRVKTGDTSYSSGYSNIISIQL